jgi:hypothetical protein
MNNIYNIISEFTYNSKNELPEDPSLWSWLCDDEIDYEYNEMYLVNNLNKIEFHKALFPSLEKINNEIKFERELDRIYNLKYKGKNPQNPQNPKIVEENKEAIGKGNFRLQSREIGLTYSRCPLEKEDLLNFLCTKLKVNKYIICIEPHKKIIKGGINVHLHAYILLDKRVDIKNPRYLDYKGYHCKMEPVKSTVKWKNYIKKDNNFITNIPIDVHRDARDLAKEGQIKDALKLLIEEVPEDFLKWGDKYEKNLKLISKLVNTPTKSTKPRFEQKDFNNYW